MLNPLSVRRVDAFPRLSEWVCSVCIAFMALVLASPAVAEKGKLRERLTPDGHGGGLSRRRRTARAGGRLAACDRGLPGRQGCRLCVFDPRYHRGARLFDDPVRRDRRRRSRRPHHRGQGGVPQRALYPSRRPCASACSIPFWPAKPAGRCAAPPTRCRRTSSPVRPSARAPCVPPSASLRGWCCARASRGPSRRFRPSMSRVSAASPGKRSSPRVPWCAGG